ncbi:2-dehydropantoate 2-reductase [Kribbella antiqua]|uniref:2-dehydropantoate 2-reductase n=1 Tax=Kribbella antiqua TaxID=2512217 RepID=A0A4R2I861_9ACTN|nr:2-dehydropantoate 2-reductase [Kribbella antiqua]
MVRSVVGDFDVPVHAFGDCAEVGEVDYVLLCVKTWQLPDAITAIAPLVGSGTAIVTVQNGVEAPDQVAAVYGRAAVLPGAAAVIAYVDGPGIIRHLGGPGRLTFAEWDNEPTPRIDWLRTAFIDAGLDAVVAADIWAALWSKFLAIVPSGGLGTATDSPYGVLRASPGTRRLLTEATTEIRDVALALGINLPGNIVETTLAWIDQLPADGTTSLQRDLLARRPTNSTPGPAPSYA